MKTHTPIAIKICGITTVKQAIEIALSGADAIGVIGVMDSPRYITDSKREEIFSTLTKKVPHIERVWVLANTNAKEIDKRINRAGSPSIIQLHGQESKEECKKIKHLYPHIKLWKSFRIRKESDLISAQDFQDSVDAILIDAWSSKSLGGTGKRIDMELLYKVNFTIPWWLAGGISDDCIEDILLRIKPFGIDASSKLEIKPGIKDMKKVKTLIKKTKLLDSI